MVSEKYQFARIAWSHSVRLNRRPRPALRECLGRTALLGKTTLKQRGGATPGFDMLAGLRSEPRQESRSVVAMVAARPQLE
jgi:hypothetical protein